MLNAAFSFIKRDFLLTVSYKLAFITDILRVLFVVIASYYIGKVAGSVAHLSLESYENSYFAFLLIGIALIDYMTVSLTIFNTSIRENQMMGTLEILLLSPMKLSQILLCSSLWAYIFSTFKIILCLAFGILMFGLDLGRANVFGAITVLVLSIFCFVPLGIISATTVILFKKGEWFKILLTGASFLLSGVVYPINVLPTWLASLSFYIPMTHSLHGMRQALFQGNTLSELSPEILFLTIFSIIFIPLSIISFRFSINVTKKTGTLAHY